MSFWYLLLGELKTPKRHFEINWPLLCCKRIWAAWNLDEFIKVICFKNSDRNASSWIILPGESRWLWKSFRIHQEFCCHLQLRQNSWQSISICCPIFGILLPKLFWPTLRKNCSSNQEKHLEFEAEGREFAKFLISLEQFIQTVKGQNNFW